MKVSRLRTLIDEISSLTLEEQRKQVKDFFFEWMGTGDQVDDVLFMGLKV